MYVLPHSPVSQAAGSSSRDSCVTESRRDSGSKKFRRSPAVPSRPIRSIPSHRVETRCVLWSLYPLLFRSGRLSSHSPIRLGSGQSEPDCPTFSKPASSLLSLFMCSLSSSHRQAPIQSADGAVSRHRHHDRGTRPAGRRLEWTGPRRWPEPPVTVPAVSNPQCTQPSASPLEDSPLTPDNPLSFYARLDPRSNLGTRHNPEFQTLHNCHN